MSHHGAFRLTRSRWRAIKRDANRRPRRPQPTGPQEITIRINTDGTPGGTRMFVNGNEMPVKRTAKPSVDNPEGIATLELATGQN